MSRPWAGALAVVVPALVGLAPTASPSLRAPRILAAAMVDADGDFRADSVRLTYSKRVHHPGDRDRRYPFVVAGYTVRSVGAASGRSLVLRLVEKAQPDADAHPAIRYRSTRHQPVTDLTGRQAIAQVFPATRRHGHVPPPADSDGDGILDAADCGPRDAAIHPGAADVPDLSFVDSNCDGIDGTEADAVFVSPSGNDAGPGTKAQPKRELQAAIETVTAGTGRYVLVAAGSYKPVRLATGVGIYGGYDSADWSRRTAALTTSIKGVPEGVLADGATRVVLQNLSIRGTSNNLLNPTAYGIRAVNGSALTLQRVTVTAGTGAFRGAGGNGRDGVFGERGKDGEPGACDDTGGAGGDGGASLAGQAGGNGGDGGFPLTTKTVLPPTPGGSGQVGTPGGPAGTNANPGLAGGNGANGVNGSPGAGGFGSGDFFPATERAVPVDGGRGVPGHNGAGGGGGGGGGGQEAFFAIDGAGNGGGGGGGGGEGGGGGFGGSGGGGSFGVYLDNSLIVLATSSITAADGGAGGNGGEGGLGGNGGDFGRGGTTCLSEVGRGGDGGIGGNGGPGGGGGGGAGGPSIGILKAGTSTATVTDSTIKVGVGGAGGLGGPPSHLLVGAPPGLTGQAGKPGIAAKIYPAT